MSRHIFLGFLLCAGGVLLSGCKTLEVVSQVGATVGQATGAISEQEADSLRRSGKAVAKTFEAITPEQEYYIGRAVGATVVNTYSPYDDEAATRYINLLGQTLAQASDKPETFGGYHFLVLDSDEINAFSAPGGLIFVSRGMLRLCKDEDDLAAVLAHEVGHVQFQHGLRAIKKSRLTSALTILAAESAKSFGGQELAQLTEAFEGSISDITSTMMNSGYARKLERQADEAAVTIMQRVGYDPAALVDVLHEMKKQLKPGGHDFAKTHPDPDDRIKDIREILRTSGPVDRPPQRQKRFEENLGAI
ncbi:MAG: M48 family metalloprotease [Verrucomicrobia bacterium]|nr:M48 family metalloprotease [Verrucomicrobiota bacterium]